MQQAANDREPWHYPVLLKESLDYLAIRPDGIYADVTSGLGGHTGAIAQRLTTGFVIACDRDAESLELARGNTSACLERIRYFHRAFSQWPQALESLGILKVDGVLADLGVSRYQFSAGERGFSIMEDGPLDMRMDRSQGVPAADFVNRLPEKALAILFLSTAKKGGREESPEQSFARGPYIRLAVWLRRLSKPCRERGEFDPATQTFMALRLKVNEEFEELEALLRNVPEHLNSGGRFVVLTFMSTEDRKVKRAFQALAAAGQAKILTKHVIRPSEQEIAENAASRSAKLRALEWF